MNPPSAAARLIAAAALAALPWLVPFAPGPTASAVPWLVTAGCAIALWSLARWPSPGWRLPALSALLVAWAGVWHLPATPELAFLAAGLVVVLLGAANGRGARDGLASAVQAGWLLAAVLGALIGLCQYFGVAAHFSPWMSPAQAGEALGNLRQTNQFASLCALGIAVVLWGRLQLPHAVAAAAMVLLAAGSAASVSRTGLLQMLVIAALALAWSGPAGRRERILLCLWAVAGYVAGTLLLPLALEADLGQLPERTLWGRLNEGTACGSRRVLWSNVLHLIALKPLAGWGWGELDYAHFMTLYPGVRFCDILDNAHNLTLHLAVELGIPAAVAVCGGLLAWAWRAAPWREREPLRQLAWAVLALVALHSLLEYPLWYGPFQLATGIAVGWLLLPAASREDAASSLPLGPLVAGVLAATALHAAWDYHRVSQVYLEPERRVARWREDPLAHARHSWLFRSQAAFADLTLSTLTPRNADWVRAQSEALLHYSPEPRIIERAIESATLLRQDDQALLHLARYRAAFPEDFEKWRQANRRALQVAPPQ